MNTALLRQWLGLPDATWPPDPAQLLGVKPGERDPARLEQIVHDRIANLRCYQISHPEEATEGMNRLAQAYLQLMEAGPVVSPIPAAAAPTQIVAPSLDWQQAPPPVRGNLESSGPIAVIEAPPLPAQAAEELVTFTLVPKSPPPDPTEVTEAEIRRWAVDSLEARTGLATLAALVDRVYQTRALLYAWQLLGKYLRKATPRTKLTSSTEFAKRVAAVVKQSAGYPEFFGQPGKPGYRVVALARLPLTPEMFDSMDKAHRQLLANDWANGEKVLLGHRRFLFEKFKKLRRSSSAYVGLRAVGNIVRESPILATILVILALALLIASLYFSI